MTDCDVADIRMNLEESDLSIFADVIAFDSIAHAPVRDEIERWVKTLFERSDLVSH